MRQDGNGNTSLLMWIPVSSGEDREAVFVISPFTVGR